MCIQITTSFSCARCKTTPQLAESKIEHCAHALQSGGVCWNVDLRERIVKDIGCRLCQQPTAPAPFNKRPFGWAQIPDTVRVMPSYHGQHPHPSPPLAGSADRMTVGGNHHQPHQPQTPYQRTSQPNDFFLDLDEPDYRPGAGLYEQPAHLYGPGGPLHPDALYPRAPPQNHMPDLRPEDQFPTEDAPFRYPAVPTSTSEREKLATNEQDDFQRAAFDQSRQENEINGVKTVRFGHGGSISAFQDQVALEGQKKAQFNRERPAVWEQYPTEKKKTTTWWDTLPGEARPLETYRALRRGNNQSTAQKPPFIVGGGNGTDKEVWVGGVTKVNGRLYEHRKKLKLWE